MENRAINSQMQHSMEGSKDHHDMHHNMEGSEEHHDMHHMQSSSSMMMMSMFFHGGFTETVLFDFWKTDSVLELILAMVIVCILAVGYEALKLARETQLRKTFETQGAQGVDDGGDVSVIEQRTTIGPNAVSNTLKSEVSVQVMSVRTSMLSSGHMILTAMHVLQTALAYLLMLVVMTYNTWLFLSVILGAGIGYFLFGWKRTILIDEDNACH